MMQKRLCMDIQPERTDKATQIEGNRREDRDEENA
jgi:hypothetical protein